MAATMRSKKAAKGGQGKSVAAGFNLFWKGRLDDYVTALAWSADGRFLAVSSSSDEVLLWSGDRPVSL